MATILSRPPLRPSATISIRIGVLSIPQWPAVGEIMATAIQAALVGQAKPKDALADAQKQIDQAMRS